MFNVTWASRHEPTDSQRMWINGYVHRTAKTSIDNFTVVNVAWTDTESVLRVAATCDLLFTVLPANLIIPLTIDAADKKSVELERIIVPLMAPRHAAEGEQRGLEASAFINLKGEVFTIEDEPGFPIYNAGRCT